VFPWENPYTRWVSDSPGQPAAAASSLVELDALLADPGRWRELDPDKLRHLLFYRCLSYGLQPDESLIPSLMALHRAAVDRLHPAVRRHVVVHLARAVERVHREHQLREGAGCTNALLPFLLEDPDPSVVSAATMEMAMLLPLDQGDPLTGPRYLRGLSDQVAGEDGKAGLVAGLLQLGDARVEPLVDGAWRDLGTEGRQTLALLIQGFHGLNMPTLRFLVSWLADEASDAASAAFGTVAATLARAGRHAAEHGADEFERVFPLSDATESDAAGSVRHLSPEECRGAVEGQLVALAWREVPPRLMPHVLSCWELHDQAYRLAVAGGVAAYLGGRSEATAGTEPVRLDLVPDWPEQPERETLLEWGIFNPLGPTINTLRLTPSPSGSALVYSLYHPGGSASRVMAVLPGTPSPRCVAEAIVRALTVNGVHAVWLVRSLPDYVHVPAGSCLGRDEIAAGLAGARAAAERAGEESLDLRWHAERLRRLALDPWTTADAEIRGARAATMDGGGERPADPRVIAAEEVGIEAYRRWLEAAAEPAHVERVRSQIPLAWQRVLDPAGEDERADGM
jgi:hypothetical protein